MILVSFGSFGSLENLADLCLQWGEQRLQRMLGSILMAEKRLEKLKRQEQKLGFLTWLGVLLGLLLGFLTLAMDSMWYKCSEVW